MKSVAAGRGNPEPRRLCAWEVNGHWPDVFPTYTGNISCGKWSEQYFSTSIRAITSQAYSRHATPLPWPAEMAVTIAARSLSFAGLTPQEYAAS